MIFVNIYAIPQSKLKLLLKCAKDYGAVSKVLRANSCMKNTQHSCSTIFTF